MLQPTLQNYDEAEERHMVHECNVTAKVLAKPCKRLRHSNKAVKQQRSELLDMARLLEA